MLKKQDIVFTNIKEIIVVPKQYYPKPAKFEIPNWYKELNSYIDNKKEYSIHETDTNLSALTTATVKKCMPVFDSITSGYIIYSVTDLFINNEDKSSPLYVWPSVKPVDFHTLKQIPNYPLGKEYVSSYPKWINPWAIKTPKGYSTLFVQPFHRESLFTILPGIVDTDTYSLPVNFPFILKDVNFTGLIPAGTPIAQVIPFKRDSWEIRFDEQEKSMSELTSKQSLLRSKFFDGYKTLFRQDKEYK